LNPKVNVSAITLQSEKEHEEQRSKQIEMEEEDEIKIKMSIKKKQLTPLQTKITNNTPKASHNSMNFSFFF